MLYRTMDTNEVFTLEEIREMYEMYEDEMLYESFEDCMSEMLALGNQKIGGYVEIPQYDVFWVGGERDGETLFSTDDEIAAINKAYELNRENEELFETKCDWGIAIMDNATRKPLENW